VSTYILYILSYSAFSYSGLILVLTCSVFCRYCYSRCGRLTSYSLSKGRLLYSFIFVHISYFLFLQEQIKGIIIIYFYFSLTGYFYFNRVVRNKFSCLSTQERAKYDTCRWTLGTIERRCGVMVLVKPLPKSVCVYYCSTYYKTVRVGGRKWRSCAKRDYEPRPM
jgi:hypothetical protein